MMMMMVTAQVEEDAFGGPYEGIKTNDALHLFSFCLTRMHTDHVNPTCRQEKRRKAMAGHVSTFPT